MTVIENLPESWAIASVGDVCSQPQYGYTTKAANTGDLRLLRTSDITSGKICWGTVPYCSDNPTDWEKYIVKDGDILVSRAGSVGVSYLITKPLKAVFASYLIRFKSFIDRQFLAYFLQSPNYWVAIADEKLGIAVSNVNATKLKSITLPVPPVAEQHRIVAKIEELFSELDKGVESLKTARAKFNVYRQAVLKHAFEGKLTAQWREENKDKLETPEQLLARIKQERGARYEQQLQEWKTAVKKWEGGGKRGRKPRKPHAPNLTTEFSKNFAVESDKLPFGWAWAEIGALFDVVSGATPKGLDQATGSDMPFYKVSDMNTSGNETRMDTSAIYLSEPERIELGLTAYPEGTVIFPKRGGAILTNKKRILSHPACFDLNTMGVVNSIASISKRYLWHWFQSLDLAKIYDGSNVPQINNKNVEPLPFPICSIEEQREIASILEKTFSVLDETEAEVVQELRKAAALRQSILKKAFAGQLVPQDPDDEPASILLERIKAAKAARSQNNTRARRRRTAATA